MQTYAEVELEQAAPEMGGAPDMPLSPGSLSELDIPDFVVFDIALRFLLERSVGSLMALRNNLKLSHTAAQEVFQTFREQRLIEIKQSLLGGDYQFELTTEGRKKAVAKSETCRYAGPVPVSLRQYAAVVQAQGKLAPPEPEKLRERFSHLVVADRTFDQLGSALVSHRPLFVYGPPGNGKTSIMEGMMRLFDAPVYIPYAVEVDGQIITVFDSVKHVPLPFEQNQLFDRRWAYCRRPSIVVAGEIKSANLNLNWEDHFGVYSAPLQMKANNGILCIDDFGRQASSPQQLLNRLIMPLDRGDDYLSLRHGFTFNVPFVLMLAFATNMQPAEIADEAFLRRIPSKVFIGSLTPEMFDEVFRRGLRKFKLNAGPEAIAHFRNVCGKLSRHGLQGCYPRDILEILVSSATYRREAVEVNAASVEAAAEMYFAHSWESADATAA
jgi:hypothetical protein